jgi:peptidoglycan biosynthesis protein MviN/MurJ (putative lipid II flippase)
MAQMNLIRNQGKPVRSELNEKGTLLAVLQSLQIASGFLGQTLLLLRWSPHIETDTFLIVNTIPGFVSASLLVGGIEFALPSIYQKTFQEEGKSAADAVVSSVILICFIASIVGMGITSLLIFKFAGHYNLSTNSSMWLALLLGIQILPSSLGGVWRGLLLGSDKLVQMRLALLSGSLITVIGYAFLPGTPAIALSGVVLAASIVSTVVAWRFSGFKRIAGLGRPKIRIGQFVGPLLSLTVISALVNLQIFIERTMISQFDVGSVTAFSFAVRALDTLMAVIVAACVTPAFPGWANQIANQPANAFDPLLIWSLKRTLLFVLGVLGLLTIALAIYLSQPNWFNKNFSVVEQTVQFLIVCLPRFFLLGLLQPFIHKHFARGTPWHVAIGTLSGIIVLAVGSNKLISQMHLAGFSLILALSVMPGFIYLITFEIKSQVNSCAY